LSIANDIATLFIYIIKCHIAILSFTGIAIISGNACVAKKQ